MEEGSRRTAAPAPAAVLPDELILEILARLPAKSLCRCKCVSRAWRTLISDPANRRRFAQTLSGLFFQRPHGSRPAWDFVGLSTSSVSAPPPGVDTALSFLPPTCGCGDMALLDSCNGLLLLRCKGVQESPSPPPPPFYVVCNPATREWVTLPQPSRRPGLVGCSTYVGPTMDTSTAALGFDFDPSISSHFHVFQLVQGLYGYDFFVDEVEIYSSRTGRWVLSKINCSDRDYIRYTGQLTYFRGFLHICIGNGVLSVDTEGRTWRMSRVRRGGGGWDRGSCVCHSQGRLIYVDTTVQSSSMSIYVLKDHDSEEWVWDFKQSINKQDLFGPLKLGHVWDYYTVAFHPDRDLIFFYHWSQEELISYDMKHQDVHVVCTLEVPYFEFFHETDDVRRKFFPYVPLYSRALPPSSL